MYKKKWQKPKLIVLVRGKSQEACLDSCKYGQGSGPFDNYGGPRGCYMDLGIGCAACSEDSAS